MGWGFRKSFKFGPMRLNLSKSGIGLSAGVKGARVSVGPRGTHLNVGTGGFYYRQKIGGGSRGGYRTGSGGYAGSGGGSGTQPPQIPAAAINQLPTYPQFPKHGLPRIVKTLSLIFGFLAFVSLFVVALLAPSGGNNPNGPRPVASQPATLLTNSNLAPTPRANSNNSHSVPVRTRNSNNTSSGGGGGSNGNSRRTSTERTTPAPAGATAQCRDGTYSYSQSRRGTCSHHGGVAVWY